MSAIEIAAFTFDFIGKVMIALTAILVHYQMGKDKKIDKLVIKDIRLEEIVGLTGIVFVALGYVLHLKILL